MLSNQFGNSSYPLCAGLNDCTDPRQWSKYSISQMRKQADCVFVNVTYQEHTNDKEKGMLWEQSIKELYFIVINGSKNLMINLQKNIVLQLALGMVEKMPLKCFW